MGNQERRGFGPPSVGCGVERGGVHLRIERRHVGAGVQ